MANCSQTIPHGRDMLAGLSSTGLGLVVSTGIATVITIAVFLFTVWVVRKQANNGMERYLTLYLVGMSPVVAVTSFIGIVSPRSVHIDDLVAAIYVSVSVALFFRLMILYHGGKDEMCRNLHGVKFPARKVPFCCCICLPQAEFNKKNLRRLQLMAYQIVVVRPVLLYMMAVLMSEEEVVSQEFLGGPVKSILTVITLISTITAVMSLLFTFRLSVTPLKHHGIVPKFVSVKLVLLFCDPQGMIVRLVASTGVIPCTDIFDSPIQEKTLKFILLCYEMVLVAILVRWKFGQQTTYSTEPNVDMKYVSDMENNITDLDKDTKYVTNVEANGHSYL